MYPTTHCPQFVTNVSQIPRNKYLESEPILFTPCLTFICPGKWPYCSSSWAPRWSSGERSTYQCRRHKRRGSNAWVGKIPWRRKQQPIPVFLPRKSHGRTSLVQATVHGVAKESDTTEQLEKPHLSQSSKPESWT